VKPQRPARRLDALASLRALHQLAGRVLRKGPLGDEQQEPVRLVASRLGKRIGGLVGRPLPRIANHHRHFEPEAIPDGRFQLRLQRLRPGRCGEDDVAALDIGLHIVPAELRAQAAKLRHRQLAAADVDGSEEGDQTGHVPTCLTHGGSASQ
jgi:hypothetical protein